MSPAMVFGVRVLLITVGVALSIPCYRGALANSDPYARGATVKKLLVSLGMALVFTAIAAVGVIGWRVR